MGRLILTHSRNDGAWIKGKGLSLEVTVLDYSKDKADLEITGLAEPMRIRVHSGEPEIEVAQGLSIQWGDYFQGRFRITYNADPAYEIEGKSISPHCNILVLAHKLGEGVRIFRKGSTSLDLIVRKISMETRSGEIELTEGDKSSFFHLEKTEEPLALLEGLSVRLGDKQKGRALRIVYLIIPEYNLQRRKYDDLVC